MSILFALLAALSNAFASVTQHLANVSGPPVGRGWRAQSRYLLGHPVWLLGAAALGCTFAFGALALYFGQLSVVQPLFVFELVFTLALRRFWLHNDIDLRSWGAAALLSGGLVGFLLIAHAMPGTRFPTMDRWILLIAIWGTALLALLSTSRGGSPTKRAVLYGCAAGVVWSVDAGFVKAATVVLRTSGWFSLLDHWPLYALIGTGLLGALLVQGSLHVGPLAASQPSILIVEPLAGIIVGMQLFGERLATNPWALVGEIATLSIMVGGVLFTERWAPPLMVARPLPAITEPV